MFQSYAWNFEMLNCFRAREVPRVLLVEDDNGVCLMPCVAGLRCGCVHFAGEALFDYRTALVSGDGRVLQRAWEIVAGWNMEFEATALRGENQREQWSALPVSFFANAPMIDAARNHVEDFLAAHSRLGRHSRRIRKQGVEMRRHQGSNRALVTLIYDLKAKQDVAGNLFGDRNRREFMVEIASKPESHCEIFTYETSSALVAALVTFRDRGVRRCYTTYFDRAWASYSPGQVLLFDVVAESLREGLDCDFMTGEYPYKNRLATQMVPLYRVRATPSQLQEGASKSLTREPLAA